jgi:hypothetical protein
MQVTGTTVRAAAPHAVTVLVGAAAVALAMHDGGFSSGDLATGLLAMMGTYLGALFAFRLEESRERRRDLKSKSAALNRCITVLLLQYNEVRNYLDRLTPYKSDVELAFNFPALQPPDNFDFRQKMDDLAFMLETASPQLLLDVFLEQQRFDQALAAIKQRNEFYVLQVQPPFAAAGLNNRLVTMKELQDGLGEMIFGGAMNSAKTMREHLQSTELSSLQAVRKVRRLAKTLFPADKFLTCDAAEALPDEEPSKEGPPEGGPAPRH